MSEGKAEGPKPLVQVALGIFELEGGRYLVRAIDASGAKRDGVMVNWAAACHLAMDLAETWRKVFSDARRELPRRGAIILPP